MPKVQLTSGHIELASKLAMIMHPNVTIPIKFNTLKANQMLRVSGGHS